MFWLRWVVSTVQLSERVGLSPHCEPAWREPTTQCPRAYSGREAADPFDDGNFLLELAKRHRKDYARAYPFKHIIFDDFVPHGLLRSVLGEIQNKSSSLLVTKVAASSKKSTTRLQQEQFHLIGKSTGRFFDYLNSDIFKRFLEELTCVHNLLDDPAITGAGVSNIDYGGFLNIHADFNRQPQISGWRRLNLLLYLNDAWEESFGGSLELWKTNMAHEDFHYVGKILPVFNRAVIFSTTDISMHGHMDLIVEGKSRLTLSTYYYTNEREDDLISSKPHSTIYPSHFFGTQSFTRWKDVIPSCPLIA